MTAWERKAHVIIAKYAMQAWEKNRRKPGYALPEIASELVVALGLHDDKAREIEVKRLFEVERLGAWTMV